MFIKDVVEKYIGKCEHVEQDNQHMYYCPNCNWKNPRLSINYNEDKFKCWKCGFSSKSILWLLKFLNAEKTDFIAVSKALGKFKEYQKHSSEKTSLKTELDDLEESLNSKNPKVKNKKAFNFPYEDCEIYKVDPIFRGGILQELREERELTDEEIFLYKIMYDINDDAIILPSFGKDMRFNYYVKRYMSNGFYSYDKDTKKTNIVFNEGITNFKDEVILTEGVFDAYTVGYNAIPVLGTLVYDKVITALLKAHTPKVTVAFDEDARESAMKQCKKLFDVGLNTHYVDMQSVGYKDLSEAGKEITKEILKNRTIKFTN